MRRTALILAFLASLVSVPVHASGGDGGGGPGVMAGGAPAGGAPAGAAPGRGQPSGTTTLPGGTTVTLAGPAGNRDVTVNTADGKVFQGKHIRTSHNSRTGITSVWIRNADGTRTGVHTDRQGNQSVSHHKN